jgi:hypothetical protein
MIDLPLHPGPSESQPFVLDFGALRTPPLGGPVQRINRLGNRYAIELNLPAMDPFDARLWSAALARAVTQGARWRLRQVGLDIGPLRNVVVAGAGQAGTTLAVSGGTPGAPWHAGQFFNLVAGGRRYLHQLAAAGRFAADGTAALPLAEMLRTVPAATAPLDFLPVIEGWIEGEGGVPLPRMTRERLAAPMTIRLVEAA